MTKINVQIPEPPSNTFDDVPIGSFFLYLSRLYIKSSDYGGRNLQDSAEYTKFDGRTPVILIKELNITLKF